MKKCCGLLMLMLLPACTAGFAEETSFGAEIAEWESGVEGMPDREERQEASPADPSVKEILLETGFGAVSFPDAGSDYSKIYIFDDSLVDYQDCYVGMDLSDSLPDGAPAADGVFLPEMPESGKTLSFVCYRNGTPYGVESYRYLRDKKKLYRIMYCLDAGKKITGIEIEKTDTEEDAWEGMLKTAEEVCYGSRKKEEILGEDEACLQGKAVMGKPVDDLIAVLGEPVDIQVLPGGAGRLLVYSNIVVSLRFDEKTGQELVTELAAFGPEYTGPRSIRAGCTSEEFRKCFSADRQGSGDWTYEVQNSETAFSCCFAGDTLKCWRLRMKGGEN